MDPTVHSRHLHLETISSPSRQFSLDRFLIRPRLPRQKEVSVGKGEGQLSWECNVFPSLFPDVAHRRWPEGSQGPHPRRSSIRGGARAP